MSSRTNDSCCHDLQEFVTRLRKQVDELKAQRRATPRHIAYKDLPRTPHRLHQMIAYRAETAMAQIVRQMMSRHDEARSLLRAVYSSEVDVIPINKPSP